MPKHAKKDEKKKIVRLEDYVAGGSEEEAGYEYEDEQEREESEKRLKKTQVPKAVYRAAVILLVLAVGLVIWFNRESLAPEQLLQWAKLQLEGESEGDGFPVSITGSQVEISNIAVTDGSIAVLSDTALTLVGSSGEEVMSLRHDLNQPVLKSSGVKTLLYNEGSTGFITLSGTDTVLSSAAERNILSGAVAQNGRFALGLEGEHGASQLQVFMKDGSLQYEYPFAQDYITAIALNSDATFGAVCTVRSEKGEMIAKVTVFDFNDEEPVAEFESSGDYFADVYWADNGMLYAVGTGSLVSASSSDYVFGSYDYGGRQLTAYSFAENRAFVSISAYEHSGASTVLCFSSDSEPLLIECSERAVSLSASGTALGALVNNEVIFFDYTTGIELGRASVENDAKAIALLNESSAFVLGVSEIRMAEIG